jgi:hypothetical protein
MATPADLAAKKRFIQAFFDDLRRKAAFTDDLYTQDHQDEARLLVCCYIESLGNGLAGSTSNAARNFVQAVVDHGGDPALALIHPKLLQTSLPLKSVSAGNKAALQTALGGISSDKALSEAELFAAIGTGLPPDAITFLRRELWRGRFAMIAYSNIRSIGAHFFGSPGSVSFSKMTHGGKPVAEIQFSTLRSLLTRLLDHVEALSLNTNKWFGQF